MAAMAKAKRKRAQQRARRALTVSERLDKRLAGVPEETLAGVLPPEPPTPQIEAAWDKVMLAEFFGCSESGIDKMISMGRAPPFFRAGRMLRWRPEVAREWVRQQEQKNSAELAQKADTAA